MIETVQKFLEIKMSSSLLDDEVLTNEPSISKPPNADLSKFASNEVEPPNQSVRTLRETILAL